jgi:uncharacterized protein YkwD
MKTILPLIVALFVFAGCNEKNSRSDSSTTPKTKKSAKRPEKKKLSTTPSDPGSTTKLTSSMEEEILVYVNKHRRSRGLSALQMNSVITTEAEKHSRNMAIGRTPFSHNGFESRVERITNQIGYVRASGENVAVGNMSAKQVVNGWLHSPGHRRNIEGKYTLTGIGVAQQGNGKIYYTQLFVTR